MALKYAPVDWYAVGRRTGAYRSWNLIKNSLGYGQYKNYQASASAQISYENYLKAGNERAIRDYRKNVPRPMRYPELSYPGQVARSDTAITRANLEYDTASANYYGNLPYRGAGLYGILGRATRIL